MDALGHRQLLLRAREVDSYQWGVCPAEFCVGEADVANRLQASGWT
jgi:hypothetical protein